MGLRVKVFQENIKSPQIWDFAVPALLLAVKVDPRRTERMLLDHQLGDAVGYGSGPVSNGELVVGLHEKNIELGNDKELWKQKAGMMEAALHEEAMERSKLQLTLDEANRRLRLLAREPLMSSSLGTHTGPFSPPVEVGLLKNSSPSNKEKEDIWDSDPDQDDYSKRGDDDDQPHYPYTNEEEVLELEGGGNLTKGHWESTERGLEKKSVSLRRRPAGFNGNNSVVREPEKEFQNGELYQAGLSAPLFSKYAASWKARIEELEHENSELHAQNLALTKSKSALMIEGELKTRCVELETELDFVSCKVTSAEKRRDASDAIIRELREVTTAAEKRTAKLEDSLTQRNAKVKELESLLDKGNNVFCEPMETLSYKLTSATTRADNAELETAAKKRIAKLEDSLTQRNAKVKELESLLDTGNNVFRESMETLSYKLSSATTRAENAELKASHQMEENKKMKLKSLFRQQKLGDRVLKPEQREIKKERTASFSPASFSRQREIKKERTASFSRLDIEDFPLAENTKLEELLGNEERKSVSEHSNRFSDEKIGVGVGQLDARKEHQQIAAENIAQAKAQAEENEALRSELDHLIDMHSQQAGSIDEKLLQEGRIRRRLEGELKSSCKAYNELEAHVLQQNALLSSLDHQLDMLSINAKKRSSSAMEEA